MSPEEVADDQVAPDERSSDPRPKLPFPLYTFLLLLFMVTVYIVQFLTSADPEFFSVDRYSAFYAGFDRPVFLNDREYWRILTGATLHSGVLHILLNSYALYSFGRLVELLTNRAHMTIVFLLSAIGGGVLSLLFTPDGTSVGASNGIVGLLSYLAVYAFIRRRFISPEFRKNLLINIGFILIFGLVLFNYVDNFGHIGGLLVGAVYGLFQIPRSEYVDPRAAGSVTKILGVAALAVYFLAAVLTILILVNSRSL